MDKDEILLTRSTLNNLTPSRIYTRNTKRVESVFSIESLTPSVFKKIENICTAISLHLKREVRIRGVSTITSYPGSSAQRWHRDRFPQKNEYDFNCIIPLLPYDLTRCGFTQIVAQTHSRSQDPNCIKPSRLNKPTTMYLHEGQLGIFDQTILHRGGPNSTEQERTLLLITIGSSETDPNLY